MSSQIQLDGSAAAPLGGAGGGLGGDEAAGVSRKPTRRLVDFRNITTSLLSEVDEVLCVALHATTALVGTRQGFVFEIDSLGNKQARIVASPRQSVLALSLDAEGRYCASAAIDGTVTVLPLGGGNVQGR